MSLNNFNRLSVNQSENRTVYLPQKEQPEFESRVLFYRLRFLSERNVPKRQPGILAGCLFPALENVILNPVFAVRLSKFCGIGQVLIYKITRKHLQGDILDF
jgi:hypothetical protein